MAVVVLDAIEGENKISNSLKEKLMQSGEKFSYFKLDNMNILPCRSCGACGFKSPGKCIFKDDMHEILHEMVSSNAIIMLTPVKYGGYPSMLKKAVDKFALMALPLYTVVNGHLVHPSRYGSRMLIGIGVLDGHSKEREYSFKRLVENNALNGCFEHKAIVLNPFSDMDEIDQDIADLLKGVC